MRRYIGLSAIIFLVFLAGCNTIDDRTPATAAPPVTTPTVEATPSAVPLGVETDPVAVPLGVEGNAPTGVWAPPGFLDATIWGDATGGRSPEVVDPYIQAVGVRFGAVGYSANKGGDQWVAVGVDPNGGVFWAYDPETGKMKEYPTYFTLSAEVDESVDYRVVPGSENAVLGWLGETAEGKPGGFPTLLKNGRPKTLTINGEETSATEYTTFLNTTTGEWQLRPEIAPNGVILIEGDEVLENGAYRVNAENGEYELVMDLESWNTFGPEVGSITNLSDGVQLAWSGEGGAGEVIALYEVDKGWYSIDNLTIALDPGWRVEVDQTSGQPVITRADGTLLYAYGESGELEMVPAPAIPGTFQSYHEAVDFGLQPKDAQAVYQRIMTSMAESQYNNQYWWDLGVSPTYEGVMAYLNSNDFQVPTISPNGHRLVNVGLVGPSQGEPHSIELEAGIIDFGNIRYAVVNTGMARENVGNLDLLIEKESVAANIINMGPQIFGLGFYEENGVYKPLWVHMNAAYDDVSLSAVKEWRDNHLYPNELGVIETLMDEKGSKLVTAWLLAYLQFLDDPNVNGWYFGINRTTNTATHVVPMTTAFVRNSDVLFEPIQN